MYFTISNISSAYEMMEKIVPMPYIPIFSNEMIEYGVGRFCVIERDNFYVFYIIDRMYMFDYKEFNNINDVLDYLVEFYVGNEIIEEDINLKDKLYECFGLTSSKKLKKV